MTTFNFPVLILGFNRPDRVGQLIDRLREVKPAKIYFSVDGPRSDRAGEAELVQQTRDQVRKIDWDCEVKTNFQPSNLGCAKGVSTGISWFFTEVPEGIVLEDDVLPAKSFFPYCAELLDRYRNDQRVWCISGSNRIPQLELNNEYSYRFSTIPQVWGWATWRDRWEKYSLDISNWRGLGLSNYGLLKTVNYSPAAFAYWSANFDLMAKMAVDTWDIQLVNAAMRNRALAVIPNTNLVENLGWGEEATHTKETPGFIQETAEIHFPLKHSTVKIDVSADRFMNKMVYKATTVGLVQQYMRYRASRS